MSPDSKTDLELDLCDDESRRVFMIRSMKLAGGLAALSAVQRIVSPQMIFAAEKEPIKPENRMKFLFALRDQCTGCRSCEYACSQFHEKGAVRPSVSRVYVKKYQSVLDVPMICWHCEDAPCVKACPTTPKAIVKEKDTNIIKYIDDKTCLGAKCNKCIEACPSQYLRRHPDTGWPMFCDLCDGDPQCVKACVAQSGDTAQTLRSAKTGFGVNLAYRDVNQKEAVKALYLTLFYPNLDGKRR